ncbi:MAG: ABC transporter permease [Lentisphaerae bacterium]|jgi:ABC-type lipoprotein release transport system permease subunit|nr:ABC transporter permease [Lentisphaerota bacterium]MBT4817024.1 ABC transporter permease [Lentisphaerota bacterium]MBT5606214.1 ABC transporter permease [Lentisphaerota bacterium]MBT7060396.1 ABC transporter permease [Lentisphaerota bacterium]MBT7844750.1 ABC transporter permease [Lentisphaerota bacterium]
MTSSIASRYALRSLLRHKRRTFLSVVGIGVGCGVCLFLVSYVRGESEMMMRAAAQSGTGHLRIAPRQWLETRNDDLRLADWGTGMAMAEKLDGVACATPHARTDALLAMGTRTVGVTLTGVDPEREPHLNRLIRKVTLGTYLTSGETGIVVIGKGIAERLDVGLDDDILVTASGQDGQIQGAMLRVVGIVATGSRALDTQVCHVLLEDVSRITDRRGPAEISILLDTPKRYRETADLLQQHVGGESVVLTWEELIPELAAAVEVDKTWTRLMVGVVVLVVFLGIASAQLAAVLERRREFAVLSAIGMKGGQLIRIMLTESLLLGLFGGLLSLAIGLPVVAFSATHGIDFSGLYGDADLSVSSILIDPIIYGDAGWWLVPLALGLSLTATMLSSLYPAWYALRTDPANALRVEH